MEKNSAQIWIRLISAEMEAERHFLMLFIENIKFLILQYFNFPSYQTLNVSESSISLTPTSLIFITTR